MATSRQEAQRLHATYLADVDHSEAPPTCPAYRAVAEALGCIGADTMPVLDVLQKVVAGRRALSLGLGVDDAWSHD